MSFIFKNRIRKSIIETLYNEILARRSTYFYYIGKIVDWSDPDNPDTPEDTGDYEYKTRNAIISAKKITPKEVSIVVPRINWTTGTVYDQFDENYSSSHPASSGATSLKNARFYVLTSTNAVYKCIFNNNGEASTVEPSGLDPTPTTFADGYVWKYLYTIPLSSKNKFLTDEWMPVTKSVQVPYYSNGAITSVIVDANGTGYSNSNTTITVTGDGVGANLLALVNVDGQLEDVLIANSGYGYTYASLTISGMGTNANAHVNFSEGDLNSLQSQVELSAIDGGIHAFRVHNVGNGYSVANVTVAGDGTGFQGNVVIVNNTISKISIVDPGYGFTYANVTINGDGANANVSAIMSPYRGHGFDPISELQANAILFYSVLDDFTNHGLSIDNDFRQFGIIKNLNKFSNNEFFSNTVGSSCYLVTLDSVAGLSTDQELALYTDTTRRFEIVGLDSNVSRLLLNSTKNYEITLSDVLVDLSSNLTYTVEAINNSPDFNKFSGDLLYINNETEITHNTNQTAIFKTIIRL